MTRPVQVVYSLPSIDQSETLRTRTVQIILTAYDCKTGDKSKDEVVKGKVIDVNN